MGVDAKGAIALGVEVGRELLGRREELGQRGLRRPHLFRGEDVLDEAPPFLLPLGLLTAEVHHHELLGRAFQVWTMCQQTSLRGQGAQGQAAQTRRGDVGVQAHDLVLAWARRTCPGRS